MPIRQPHDRRIYLMMCLTRQDERVSKVRLMRDPHDEPLLALEFDPPSDLHTAVDTFCGYVQKKLPQQDGVRYVIRLTGRPA